MPGSTHRRERTTMVLDNMAGAGEADAAPGDLANHVGTALESSEDAFDFILRDPDALVLHRHDRPGVRFALALASDVHADWPTVGAVLDGVVEQVAQHTPEPAAVPDPDQLGNLRDESDLVAIRPLLVLLDDLACEDHQI